jgi:hypothetical protein
VLPAKRKKYDQSDNQPDEKPHPVRYSELGHQVEIGQETDYRDQGHLFPDADPGKDNCRDNE